jgi:hypothetical protein
MENVNEIRIQIPEIKIKRIKLIDGVLYRLCACGRCGQYFKAHKTCHGVNKRFVQHHRYYPPQPLAQLCQCGCGEMAKPGSKYLRGHGTRGKHLTEEHKNKLRTPKSEEFKQNLRVPKSEEFKENLRHHTGWHHTEEVVNNARLHALELWQDKEHIEKHINGAKEFWKKDGFREAHSGENHWAWVGGTSKYPKEWSKQLKEMIRERDGHICQLCFIPQEETNKLLAVHHIDYDKDNCKPDNLISLCNGCHAKTNIKQDREQWQSIFASQ